MQSKNNVIDNILNNLTTLKQIDEQNSNEIDTRLHELEVKNNIIIKNKYLYCLAKKSLTWSNTISARISNASRVANPI